MSAIAFNPAKFLPSAAYRKAGILVVGDRLPGTSSATGSNWGHFFIAPYKCVVLSCDVVWATAGSSNATFMLEKLTGTTASGSGTHLITSAIDLTATANTVTAGTLSTTRATVELNTGDRLGIDYNSTTLTSLNNLTCEVVLAPIPSTS